LGEAALWAFQPVGFAKRGNSLGCWWNRDYPEKATFYLSGPAAMISAIKAGLIDRGVKPDKIRIDEWE
jgi:Na+-transporting NADH:ubiquinone oxidoreductase subunit NqrF